MGLYRRFYDSDWGQEGPHCAQGAGLGLKSGQGPDAPTGRRHWSEPGRDMERGAGQNVSTIPFRTLRVALARGE